MEIEILGPGPLSANLMPLNDYVKNLMLKSDPKQCIIRVVVAYAQETYLGAIGRELKTFARKGGAIEAIIGIDSGGTSARALRAISKLVGSSNLFIYHNPSDGTFHPKVYIFHVGSSSAFVVVGSSNLTAGGLANNFEVNIALELDLNLPADATLFKKFVHLFETIKQMPSCVMFTDSLLKHLRGLRSVRGKARKDSEFGLDPRVRCAISSFFKRTPHEIRVRTYALRRVTRPPARFIMSLSENDVAGIRGEPYFLVPVTARNENPRFWGWPGKYRPSAAGGFPERRFKALIQKDGVQVTEDCRLYYFRDRDEFRFKSAEVYTMGKSKAGSFLEISWRKTDQFETAKLVLTEKKHRRFGTLAKLAFKFVIGGKKWCYQ